MFRIFATAVVISCSALAGPAFDVLNVPRPADGTHMKYLINEQRVGTGFDRLSLGTFESKPAMVWTSEIDMHLTAGAKKLNRQQRLAKYFEPVVGGRLLGFKVTTELGTSSGRVVGNAFELTTPAGVRKLPLPRERLENADLARLAAFQRTTVKAWSFDVVDLQEYAREFSFVSDSTVGADRRIAVKGTEGTFTFDQRGALINALNGPIEILPRLEGDDAPEATFDTSAISIKLAAPLDDAAPRLVFLFSGLDRDDVLNVPRRQTAEVAPDGRLRFEVVRVDPALPQKISRDWAKEPELQKALGATEFIDVEQLAPIARKAAGAEKNAWAVTRALGKIVAAVKFDPAVRSEKASATLARGVGNAVDRNSLFMGLARAAGIPARKAEGLCAFPGLQLFPATWSEVFVGEWVSYNIDYPAGVAPAHCIALKTIPLGGGVTVEVE